MEGTVLSNKALVYLLKTLLILPSISITTQNPKVTTCTVMSV